MSGLATVLPLAAFRTAWKSPLQDSHLRLLTEMAKREAPLDSAPVTTPLPKANLQKQLAILQKTLLVAAEAMPLLPEMTRLEPARWPRMLSGATLANLLSVAEDLFLCRPERRSASVGRPAARARPQDSLLRRVE